MIRRAMLRLCLSSHDFARMLLIKDIYSSSSCCVGVEWIVSIRVIYRNEQVDNLALARAREQFLREFTSINATRVATQPIRCTLRCNAANWMKW